MRRFILAVVVLPLACSTSDAPARKRRWADTAAPVDSVIPTDVREGFTPPETWETVTNPNGLVFSQPPAFTLGLDAARLESCDADTPDAEMPVFDKTFMERWPLTLAMRRGDVNRIARTNGFTLDSTEIATHESGGASTTMKRGEGWLLLTGQTANRVSVLFAAVRHPAGCHLVWASRGAELHPDTLGLVLSTVRFTK